MSPRFLTLLAVALACLAPSAALAAPPFTATEMVKLKRLADPQVSPDGSRVAFALTEIDLEGGKRNTDLWLVPVAGGEPRRITTSPAADSRARWSPDGTRLAFLSTRDGGSQVWVLDLGGGEPRKLTSLATGADAFEWIDAKRLLVVAGVFPDCGADDACNSKRLGEAGKPSSARAYDALLFRHWDTWDDGRRNHLLVVPVEGGAAVDLTPGGDDVPPFSLGGQDWAVSPDGQEACFSRKDRKDEAWSTNADVFVVPTGGGASKRVGDAAGYDGACRYSPDGSLLAWRAQQRAGYEADRWRLVVLDRKTGSKRTLTESLDRAVESFVFSPDSRTLYFTAEEAGRSHVFSVPAAGGAIATVLGGGSFGDLSVLPNGKTLVATQVALTHPAEIVRFGADGEGLARVTHVNDAFLAGFRLQPATSVEYPGAGGEARAGVARPAARLRPREEVPAPRPRPRRAARGLDRRVDLPLERAGLRERGLRGLHAQPPRLDRVGAGAHRRRQPGLGREGLRGRHEGDRLRRVALLRREGPHRRPPAPPTAAT